MNTLLENLYDLTNKTNILVKTNPETSEIVQDIISLFVGIIDKYEERFKSLNDEMEDHKEKLWDLHNRTMNIETSFNINPYKENGEHKCSGDCKQPSKQDIIFTNEDKELANSLFKIPTNDNMDYKTFINSKKIETKDFITSVSVVSDDKKLDDNLDVLNSFINSKI
jgi:hypothetical protein